jgi:poly(A) polymerase
LQRNGYEAYIVGGGVRDLLLGKEPKDFDIATSATPEQVQATFRRCRLIGRRFRLAHVLDGREMIEVATFRGQGDNDGTHHHLEGDRIIRDNQFGTVEEDALRRDFTINALFLDVSDWTIRDFVGGYEDLKSKTLRLIGDPETRYREDPVRLLRAARFIAKLGLQVEAETEAPLDKLGVLLHDVPAARLFEEVNKLFLSGHAESSLKALQDHGLMRFLFPLSPLSDSKKIIEDKMLQLAMQNTDSRIHERKPVTPAFLYAVLLWPPVRERVEKLQAKGSSPMDALRRAGEEVMLKQIKTVAIPRRFGSVSREIWSMQTRFRNQRGRRAERLLRERRFRAAYDFLLLRAEVDPELRDSATFWTDIQEMSPEEQRQELQIHKSGRSGSPRRKRSVQAKS